MSGDVRVRIEALERRVRAAEDVQAIHRLKARYAQLVDARCPRDRRVEPAELDDLARRIAERYEELLIGGE